MAKKVKRCWAIDIGQCAIKALRCTLDGDQVIADAFDYIEYPKILSQPEAEPEQLIREALETFLSRNEISRRDDKVAISVPGQSGLAKFFKPPPVDIKRLPAIVKFEAKQQIPFPLEEVIWDYQKLVGGAEVDGFVIDAEVGLFAMKREQVFRALKPFDKADIQLDIVQLAPMSIYNFVTHDILTDGPDPDLFDADNPPESIVVLSLGTDATDLVVTNGFRMWQRSIPLGGNHFTKQLTKELKLTFAKAEHLKRNARQAEDPKTVFQAMRPIFNDLVTEVQRSVGYFQGLDRKAKIRGVVLLGNTTKLPGLQQYIAKNLGYDVIPFDKFNLLTGDTVLTSPQFSENAMSFGVCYGLCLQGLGKARLGTNLLPKEIMTKRLIKSKKPWAVASIGALMLACSFNFFFHYNVWSKVKEDASVNGKTWSQGESQAAQVQTTSNQYKSTQADKEAQLAFIKKLGEEVVGSGDRRLLWLELITAVNSALPWPQEVPPGTYVDFKTLPFDQRPQFYLEYVESEYFPDLATWFVEPVQDRYFQLQRHLKANSQGKTLEEAEAAGETADAAETTTIPGPTGPGWVVEMKGYHYYKNNDAKTLRIGGANHVRNNFLRVLEEGTVELPVDNGASKVTFTMKELGIQFPILASDEGEPVPVNVPNPDVQPTEGAAGQMGNSMQPGMEGMPSSGQMAQSFGPRSGPATSGPAATGTDPKKEEEPAPPFFKVRKYAFTIQFCWQEKRLSERLKIRKEEEEKKKAEAEAAAANAAANPPAVDPNPTQPADAAAQPAPNAAAAPAGPAPAEAVPENGATPQAVAPDPAAQPTAVPATAVPADNGGQPNEAAPTAAPPPANAAPAGPGGAN